MAYRFSNLRVAAFRSVAETDTQRLITMIDRHPGTASVKLDQLTQTTRAAVMGRRTTTTPADRAEVARRILRTICCLDGALNNIPEASAFARAATTAREARERDRLSNNTAWPLL